MVGFTVRIPKLSISERSPIFCWSFNDPFDQRVTYQIFIDRQLQICGRDWFWKVTEIKSSNQYYDIQKIIIIDQCCKIQNAKINGTWNTTIYKHGDSSWFAAGVDSYLLLRVSRNHEVTANPHRKCASV